MEMLDFTILCALVYAVIAFCQYVTLANAIDQEESEKQFKQWRLEFWKSQAESTARQAREIGQLVDRCGREM